MIAIKNEHELESMRQACRITAAARALAGEMVRPGVSTKAIDKAVHDYIVGQGAKPSFLNYNGCPASTCISVNATVIHGIPGGYTLKEGDIVSVDVEILDVVKACKAAERAVVPACRVVFVAEGVVRELESLKTRHSRYCHGGVCRSFGG